MIIGCSGPGVFSTDSSVSWSGERICFSDGSLLEVTDPFDLIKGNKIIVQIFPFSSFLNSVDLIRTRN
tara:strand:- start:35 stop:238 length:204 start_codon:yes stop_codon:yes gene_type:complete